MVYFDPKYTNLKIKRRISDCKNTFLTHSLWKGDGKEIEEGEGNGRKGEEFGMNGMSLHRYTVTDWLGTLYQATHRYTVPDCIHV